MRALALAFALAFALAGCTTWEDLPEGSTGENASVPVDATPSATPTPAPIPKPTPTPKPEAWPREGSLVRMSYHAVSGANESFGNLTWTYRAGAWQGACVETWKNGRATGTLRVAVTAPPLTDTRSPPAVGLPMTGAYVDLGCRVTSEGRLVFDGAKGAAYHASAPSEVRDKLVMDTAWRQDSGLVVSWARGVRGAGSSGALVETDAPARVGT